MLHWRSSFQSDSLQIVEGLPKGAPTLIEQKAKGKYCLALRFNTYYPELPGGYYFNRNLLVQVENVLRDIGIYLVESDNFDPNYQYQPLQPAGSISVDTSYKIVGECGEIGVFLLWEMGVGGSAEFYRDCLVGTFIFGPNEQKYKQLAFLTLSKSINS